ncbi:GIY-YIG catalytic domain-containing endonuclease [Acanthocystis turfacea Chlorella virus MN0810.1]|nr:GIY-YIG catalytic domain-containing endonuclease [Acanthocystis turfacea Chlorella virus MN0810.1]
MGFIYRLTSPSGKSYIGQTIRTIKERFKDHQSQTSGCVAIYNAIQYHGWESMKKEWFEVPDEDLDFHEEMLIALLGTLSPDGYNLTRGGAYGKMCEEVKKKIGDAHRGKIITDDQKQKLSVANLGKTHTDGAKQKISEATIGENNPFYGKTHTDESKKKMSEAKIKEKNPFYGKTHKDGTKNKMSESLRYGKHPKSKKVYQYELDGTFVQSFPSTGEAARSMNKKSGSSIRDCARGKLKTIYGFKWSYTEL